MQDKVSLVVPSFYIMEKSFTKTQIKSRNLSKTNKSIRGYYIIIKGLNTQNMLMQETQENLLVFKARTDSQNLCLPLNLIFYIPVSLSRQHTKN